MADITHIVHRHSSDGSAPSPQEIVPGEIAVGYGAGSEMLYIKNSAGSVIGFSAHTGGGGGDTLKSPLKEINNLGAPPSGQKVLKCSNGSWGYADYVTGGGASNWSNLEGKPFDNVGSGLSTTNHVLNLKLGSGLTINSSSALTVNTNTLKLTDFTHTIPNNYIIDENGSANSAFAVLEKNIIYLIRDLGDYHNQSGGDTLTETLRTFGDNIKARMLPPVIEQNWLPSKDTYKNRMVILTGAAAGSNKGMYFSDGNYWYKYDGTRVS
jgi:hypothetical protein